MTDRPKAGDAVKFAYTNHRGERSIRTARLGTLQFKTSQYHEGMQHFIRGWDEDKKAVRDYALKDCDFTTTTLPDEVTEGNKE